MSEVPVIKTFVAGFMVGASLYSLPGDSAPAPPTAPVSAPAPECSVPPTSVMSTVDRLFTDAPLIDSTPYNHEPYTKSTAQIAGRIGVTLPDDTLQTEIDDATHEPFSWYFSTANRFLGQFGVAMTIAKPDELSSGSTNVPSSAQLDSKAAKYDITEVVDGFSEFPTQYIHFSGLKKIVLAVHTGDAAYAKTGGNHSVIALDVGNLSFGSQIGDHEDYHLIDSAECGGPVQAANDPAFVALNDGIDIYSPIARKQEITIDDLNSTIISDELNAENAGNHVEACKDYAIAKEEAMDVVATTRYSLTNEVEDKAQIGADFAFPTDYADDLDSRSPIVRNKFLLLMARLYQWQPRVVQYLAAVSTRPSDDSMFIPKIKNC